MSTVYTFPLASVEGAKTIATKEVPHNCPYCFHDMEPSQVGGYMNMTNGVAYVGFYCPRKSCREYFVGGYTKTDNQYYGLEIVLLGFPMKAKFSEIIQSISPGFIETYNQAVHAEHYRLSEIAGIGFRKALEFLIKDYIIHNKPDIADQVKKEALGPCIEKYIDIDQVKEVAKRAVWLGNDETHYVKKWIDKDITDLKKLISLTIHWIDAHESTKQYISSMPK